jgi:hypothetical protein
MTEHEQRVANLIRTAFTGVVLGDGVGLRQAQALDDYADFRTVESCRAQDHKDDWAAISAEDLDYCYSSLSFFDPEGMRFHLPAFLIADLEGKLKTADVLFHLTFVRNGAEPRFDILSSDQRNAVREFLLLRLSDPDAGFEHPRIKTALRDYWSARTL